MDKINVITLFSGYDSQCMALDRLGIPYDLVAWSEIDKNAIEAHNTIYPQWADRNLGDVAKIDWSVIDKPIDLLTYSSPCQDFSFAGKQRGGEKDSGTRSSLLWECERAIEALHPKYLMLENVAALVSKKFKPLFLSWLDMLETMGYASYWNTLNAKDFGVPQSRKRVFCISKLKEADDTPFVFPEPFELTRTIKDVLEPEVDDYYYLDQKHVSKFKFYL